VFFTTSSTRLAAGEERRLRKGGEKGKREKSPTIDAKGQGQSLSTHEKKCPLSSCVEKKGREAEARWSFHLSKKEHPGDRREEKSKSVPAAVTGGGKKKGKISVPGFEVAARAGRKKRSSTSL